jgi:phosphopantetheine adenylyltransferase
MPIQIQKASRTSNRVEQNRTTPQHIIIKTMSTENRERLLRAVREKNQITYEDHSRFLNRNLKSKKSME